MERTPLNVLFHIFTSPQTPLLTQSIGALQVAFVVAAVCCKLLSNNSSSSNNKLLQFLAELQWTLEEHFVSRSISLPFFLPQFPIFPLLHYLFAVRFFLALFNISSLMFSLALLIAEHFPCVCVVNVLISAKPQLATRISLVSPTFSMSFLK